MKRLYDPKAFSFLIALVISVVVSSFLGLIKSIATEAIWVAALSSFVSSFILVYFTLEFLFFREIYQLYRIIGRLKKKDFKKARKKLLQSNNPIRALRHEIFTLSKKQEKELDRHMKTMERQEKEIDQLKQLQEYRRDFLADVSHELKTPIFSAQGFIHTLLDGAIEDNSVRQRFLENAAKSLEGLENLVNDLLILTKLETGSLRMNPKNFDLATIIEEVFEQLELKAQERNVELILTREGSTLFPVYADRMRIMQVFTNLITNAIKYGKEGGFLRITINRTGKFAHVTVADNGPGIGPEHLKRIFERLYRIEKSRSKDKGGSGLGLAIVKQILQSHGSDIQVESQIGKGTIFMFSLPAANPNENGVSTQEAENPTTTAALD